MALKNSPSISVGDDSLQENENRLADIIIETATIAINTDINTPHSKLAMDTGITRPARKANSTLIPIIATIPGLDIQLQVKRSTLSRDLPNTIFLVPTRMMDINSNTKKIG